MTDSEKILNAALEYLDMGLSVIPVNQITKASYVKWKKYQTELPTPEEVEEWWRCWPDANVAIITGGISGKWCVDGDGPKGIAWMTENLPKTGVYSATGNGIHAIFLVPAGVKIKNKVEFTPEVDVRGDGGYFVAPPSIHENGHRYEWKFIMDGWDDLTELDLADVLAKLEKDAAEVTEGSGNLNLDLSGVKPMVTNEPVAEGSRNNTLTQLVGKWIRAGLDDSEIEVLALAWNNGNKPPLELDEVKKTIKSIRGIDNEKQLSNPDVEIEELTDSDYIGGFNNKVPEYLLNPGGILQEMMDLVEVNSAVVNRYFSLGACITALGSVVGQKFMTATGLRTNFYNVGVGLSGTGKDAPLSVLTMSLIARTAAAPILGPTDVTSVSAILRHMCTEHNPVTLMMMDEFGMLLKGMKSANSHSAGIPGLLTDMFSAKNLVRKQLAGKDAYYMPWHHLSIYGTSTPTEFWEAIGFNETSNGLIARMLVFETMTKVPLPKDIISMPSPSLEKTISDLYQMQTPIDEKLGNIAMVPIPKTIPHTDEAKEFHMAETIRYNTLQNANLHEPNGIHSIYGRGAEQAQKLALVHAISKHGTEVKHIELDSTQWAWALIDFIVPNMIWQIRTKVGGTPMGKAWVRVVEGVRHHYRTKLKGPTKSNIYDFVEKGWKSKDLQDLLNSMVEAGDIGVRKETRGTRQREVYFPVQVKAPS